MAISNLSRLYFGYCWATTAASNGAYTIITVITGLVQLRDYYTNIT